MNLPNKLTLLRVLMIPAFLVVLLLCLPNAQAARWIAAGIFALASFTDWLDGYIARRYKLVTNFGKFADPLADKLLVCAAIIALTEMGEIASWVTIVIVSRELIVTGFRLLAVEQGLVLAAGFGGKLKTAVTMVTILWILVFPVTGWAFVAGQVLIYVSAALTVYSAIEYIAKNLNVLRDVK